MKWNDTLTISVNVRNSGARQGDHTVLLYVSDLYRSITPPNKELKGYTKLPLTAGEQKTVQFTLTRNDLSFIGLDLTRQTEAGTFTVAVGALKANFTLLGSSSPAPSAAASQYHEHVLFTLFAVVFFSFSRY
jgi:beta-glucosidase